MSALKTPPTACSQLNTPPGLLDSITSDVRTPTTDQQTLTSPCPAPGATYCSTRTEQAAVSLANSSGTMSACKSIPLAGVCIPDLPWSQGGWHITLRQWYNIDPKTGCALKDWPDAWFKESMRAKMAAKQSQQALIAYKYKQQTWMAQKESEWHTRAKSQDVSFVTPNMEAWWITLSW
ncbi:hypothetical protein L208DRAFT_1488670 [Tricholoma matsutake]|nr:hypothetical protein L208DRAFT_1488670 [Tricholoma matsutake 945]